MLPLGFEFDYVTCFGQWIIKRPKAWRVFDKHLKMRRISFVHQLLLQEVHTSALCLPPEEDERHMEQRCSTTAKSR